MNAAAAQLGISRIGQIAINVHDLDRATAFYGTSSACLFYSPPEN